MQTENVGGADVYIDEPKVAYSWKSESMVYQEKSRDFYSTVLVFAAIISLVLFFIEGLMPVLLVAAVVFFIFVVLRREPEIVLNEIREDGVISAGKKYVWDEIQSYWIEKRAGRDMVRLMTVSWPWHLVLVLPKDQKEIELIRIKRVLDDHIEMVVPVETGTDRFIGWIKKRFPFE